MLRRALAVALVLLAAAPSAARAAAPAVGVDRPVPRDALGYAVVDSIEALMSMSVPTGASPGAPLPPTLLSPEVDRGRPLAVTWLAGGGRLLHLPAANPTAIHPADGWTRKIVGADYAVLLSDDAPPIEEITRDPVVPVPSLSGAFRGFVDADALRARMGTPAPGDLAAGIGRIDFAMTVDGGAMHVEVALAPRGTDGFLAAFARAEVARTPNRFLAALPAGSQIAVGWRMTREIAAAWERLTVQAMAQAGGPPARSRRLEREARHWASVTGGDSAMAVSGIGTEGVRTVQAGGCRDRAKMRRLLRRLMRHGGDRTAGVEVVELRQNVASFDGVEVDEQRLRLALPQGGAPPNGFMSLFTEPVRYAYPPDAVVSVMGAGGLPVVRDAVAGLASGVVDPVLAAAIDPRAVMSVVVDVRELGAAFGMPGMPPDMPTHATLNVVPHDGVVSMRLTVPSMLLRFLPSLLPLPQGRPPDRT